MTPTDTRPYQTAAARRAKRQWWLRGGAAVAGLALIGVLGWRFWPRTKVDWVKAPRAPVAVLPFEVRGSAPELDGIGIQFAEQVTAAIRQAALGDVVVVRMDAGTSARDLRRIARATGANTLVTGVITARGDSVTVQAEVVRAGDLRTIWLLGPEGAPAGAIGSGLAAMQERILGAVGDLLHPANAQRDVSTRQPPPTLELFTLHQRADALEADLRFPPMIQVLEEAWQKDTTYLPSAFRLHAALLNARRWEAADTVRRYLAARLGRVRPYDRLGFEVAIAYHTRSPEELYRAVQAQAQVDSSNRYMLLYAAQRSGRLEEAIRRFLARDTASGGPDDWLPWELHVGQAYHGLGRYEEHFRLMRNTRTRHPTQINVWEQEIRALAALGWTDSVTALIAESSVLANPNADGVLMRLAAQEFGRHGHAAAAAAMWDRFLTEYVPRFPTPRGRASLERQAYEGMGRYAEAVRLVKEFEPWAEASPQGFNWRARWMPHAVMAGDTTGAQAMVDSLRTATVELQADRVNPTARALYTGAQILSVLGRRGEAVGMLVQSLNTGYRLEMDEELMWYWAPIRDYPQFQALMRPKR